MDSSYCFNGEQITPLNNYPGYGVTKSGKLFSLPKQVWNGHSFVSKPLMQLKGNKIGKGYLQVKLYVNKQKINLLIHVLIAKTFIPNSNPKLTQVNHIDGNKTNNNVSNLEWCDNGLNQIHAWKMGLQPNKRARRTTGGVRIAEIDDNGNIIKEYSHAKHAEEEIFGYCKNGILNSIRFNCKYKGHKFIKL